MAKIMDVTCNVGSTYMRRYMVCQLSYVLYCAIFLVKQYSVMPIFRKFSGLGNLDTKVIFEKIN